MTIKNVVPNIARRMNTPAPIKEEHLTSFITNITDVLSRYLEQERSGNGSKNLRMSLIGRADRRIWMEINGPKIKEEEFSPSTLMRFLYGSIVEELLLFLVKEAGHTVSDEQKEVIIDGVKGHMDCKIDGDVVDIKSSSDYSFRKFKRGFDGDDDFGYIGQISGYAEAEGKDTGYFLALNKSSGELALLEVTDFDLINAAGRINHIRSFLTDKDSMPEVCVTPVPDGTSGNMRLARMCVFCEYKKECWPELRAFKYSNGTKYFTKIVKEPKVEEIHV